jgi:predicted RecA/RadA family phage recombinase
MAKNYLQPGEHLTVPNSTGAAILSGAGVVIGSLFGVAIHDSASGADLTLATKGVWSLAKVSAQAWTVGAKIYFDDATKLATTTAAAGANKLIGVATEIAANPTGTGKVLLSGAFTI